MKEHNLYINSKDNNKESIANKYALKCLSYSMVVLVLILILNLIDVFLINRSVTLICVASCFVVYCITMLVTVFGDLSKTWMKYYILTGEIILITIVATFLTYHAVLACVIPIISSSMYSSKKVAFYTYFLMVISVFVSVYAGYHFGICDANMVLLTGEPMSMYLTDNNEFNRTKVNDDLLKTLFLFFALPRSMILLAFTIIGSNISKILNLNMDYAREMENIAGLDGMTGLFNKSKYLEMSEVYSQSDIIGTIFWDINNLKIINDSKGHEFGDKLILAVAESIALNTGNNDMSYRIGGDEFIMIIPSANEELLIKKIDSWRKTLDKLQKSVDFEISVAVGYAYGKGKDFESIIATADKMMYANKIATKNHSESAIN